MQLDWAKKIAKARWKATGITPSISSSKAANKKHEPEFFCVDSDISSQTSIYFRIFKHFTWTHPTVMIVLL